MNVEIHEKIKQIKQSFRFRMNGVASQSMREKGILYKLNRGIPVPELKEMAKEYGKDYALAIELWKEDIRECMILATLTMPYEKMDEELVEVWMERVKTQEMAEILAFNLLQHLNFASALAFRWIASGRQMYELCGYNLLARLFSRGTEPDFRDINEYLDQANSALQSNNIQVKHAAYNSLLKFCDISETFETIAKKAVSFLND